MTPLPSALMDSLDEGSLAPPERLGDYAVDGIAPQAAVFPVKSEDVSEVLSFATGEGKRVTPWGGGTQMSLGNVPTGVDLVLGLSRLDRLHFHEPADLVASVEAGVTLASLQSTLARRGQFLPLEVPLPALATVGGVLAANSSGPSRLAYGTARDWLIGIVVAQADGTVTKSGGRVVKNVTGYDLNKLYIGSLGTLGVILEATFKLAPMPEDKRTLIGTYSSLSAAMQAAEGLFRSSPTPQALLVVDRRTLERLPGLGVFGGGEAAVMVLFAGRRIGIDRRVSDAARIMEGADRADSLPQDEGDALWQAVTDLGWDGDHLPELMIKVSAPPSRVSDCLGVVAALDGRSSPPGVVADVGSGQVRLLWWSEGDANVEESQRVTGALREWARAAGGHVVVERCSPEMKRQLDVWGDSLEGEDIMRRIKHQLDPSGLLNPGRFIGRI